MFGSILILFALPWLDTSKVRSAITADLPAVLLAPGDRQHHSRHCRLQPAGRGVADHRADRHRLLLPALPAIVPLVGFLEVLRPVPKSISEAARRAVRISCRRVRGFEVSIMSRSISLLAAARLASWFSSCRRRRDEALRKDVGFSFEGLVRHPDRAQVQRGYQVYKEVCAACHSMSLMRYRNLGEPGGPEFLAEQVKAIAAESKVTDGPDAAGNMFERPALPSDAFVKPFPNDNAARAANGGALPTDLSLITKSRAGWSGSLKTLYTTQLIKGMGGPEYVYSVLTGYQDPPRSRRGARGQALQSLFRERPLDRHAAAAHRGRRDLCRRHPGDRRPDGKGCVGLPRRASRKWRSASISASSDGLSSGVRGAALSGQAADLGEA